MISVSSLVSAVLASIVTFSGFSEQAARHKLAGTRYGLLVRKVEGWLATEDERDWFIDYEKLNNQWSEISDAAPITYFKARKLFGDT